MLLASFNHDQVEALTRLVMKLSHSTLLAFNFIMTLLNLVNTIWHVMSDV
jgi:hypothetical protein